jgi:hypothetical protein
VATEGGDIITVIGQFGAHIDNNALLPGGGVVAAVCRINSPPTGGTTFRHGGYLCGKAVEGNVNCVGDHIDFPATLLNATHLRCAPPAVVVGGAGALSVSLSNGTAYTFSAPLPLRYQPLVDVALGRRPYITEARGAVLLALSPRLLGLTLTVEASLPCARANWSWGFLATNTSVALTFPLTGLPPTMNNDLSVAVSSSASVAGRRTTAGGLRLPLKWRRLMRAPPPTAQATIQPAQVDHHTRALRVGNRSFLGQGWYVYGSAVMSVETMFQPVRRQAELGIDMIMPYALSSLNASDQLRCAWTSSHARRAASSPCVSPVTELQPIVDLCRFFDLCHSVGVHIMYDLSGLGFSAGHQPPIDYQHDWASPDWRKHVEGNVTLVSKHPALLAYYICKTSHSLLHKSPVRRGLLVAHNTADTLT